MQVSAYLVEELSRDDLEAVKGGIAGLPEVKSLKYLSKEDALSFLKEAFPEQLPALEKLKKRVKSPSNLISF